MRRIVVLLFSVGVMQPAAAESVTLDFVNESAYAAKVVAPGRAIILPAGATENQVLYQSDDPLGVKLNIWWKHNPLELCQLFTPWSRRVRITGKHHIDCLSSKAE